MNKTIYFLILPLLMGLAACEDGSTAAVQEPGEIARPARIVPVITNGYNMLRSYPGTLEATRQSALAFRVSGVVSGLPATAGKRVKRGELLARLDDTDYRNTLLERKARYELALIQQQQAEKLLQQNLSSQLQFDQSAAELKSAQAGLAQAEANLGYTRLTAPFPGVVARVDINNHQSVQAMTPVITLQNDDHLDIRFSVPESLISQLKNQTDPEVIKSHCGKVSFTAHPDRVFNACYKEHESLPDPVTRNYSVAFTLTDRGELALLPGMTANIELDFRRFSGGERSEGLFVPLEAVFDQQGAQWVWTVDQDSRSRKRRIEVGRTEGGLLEATRGLDQQDRVIAAGVSHVREGMLVKPLSRERGL